MRCFECKSKQDMEKDSNVWDSDGVVYRTVYKCYNCGYSIDSREVSAMRRDMLYELSGIIGFAARVYYGYGEIRETLSFFHSSYIGNSMSAITAEDPKDIVDAAIKAIEEYRDDAVEYSNEMLKRIKKSKMYKDKS